MPYGFGWGGRGGFGRRGGGGGWGYGFRGSSPPWPYIGRGRGGLPRGAYYWDTASPGYGQIPYPDYGEPGFPPPYWGPGEVPYRPRQMTRDEELDSLRDHAEMLKQQLEEIEARTQDLETSKK